jgi:hypothetical protein
MDAPPFPERRSRARRSAYGRPAATAYADEGARSVAVGVTIDGRASALGAAVSRLMLGAPMDRGDGLRGRGRGLFGRWFLVRCGTRGGERRIDDPLGVLVVVGRFELAFGKHRLDLVREWHRLMS